MDEYFPQIIRQWLGKQRGANNDNINATTKEAAYICGASQATSDEAKGTEPINRKERARFNSAVKPIEESALQIWAQNKGLWVNEHDFIEKYASRQIGAGAEQRVYLHQNGYDVIKANTGTYHGNWLEFFNRLLCHAILFPATGYSTIGFTNVDQTFAVLIQQQFALLTEGAPRSIVDLTLTSMALQEPKMMTITILHWALY